MFERKYSTKRYSKANNKNMKSYDDSKQSNYITYLDKNKLHDWANESISSL